MDDSKRVLLFLRRYARNERSLLIGSTLCAALLATTSGLTGIYLWDALGAMTHGNLHGLNLYCAAMLAVYTIRGAFTYGTVVGYAEVSQRIALRMRTDIYRHLQGLSLSYFNQQRTGAMMSTMLNDVPVVQSSVSSLKDIAPAPFLIGIGLYMIFKLQWEMALAVICAVPVMSFTINRLSKQIKQITSRTQDKLADVSTLMEETLSGIRIIKSFSAEELEIQRFTRENRSAKDLTMKTIRRQSQIKPWIDVIGAAGIAFAVWTAGQLVVRGHFNIPNMVVFLYFVNQIAVGLQNIGSVKATWEQIKAAGERILVNVMDVETEVEESPNAIELPPVQGEVAFENVSFTYNGRTPVLSEVSFVIHPGEAVAVVGASGAGKSTLADLIPRFYDPTDGRILIDGYDIRDLTFDSMRGQIGIVPQETVLFGGTIRENILYGNPLASTEEVEQAARAANAHDFIVNDLPNGYDTIVGERGKQLSGGQRQRISIARALLRDPKILILDEATSSLDQKSELLVQEALDKLMRGRTTLIIAHRPSAIASADKVIVMRAGRIVEAGRPADLIGTPGSAFAQQFGGLPIRSTRAEPKLAAT